jgi:hypothetical protein
MRATSLTILWGVFCACSWTWCIGMFLPALMIDRFGWPGFVVFAIPNVIGCAGFGYVLRRRGRSRAMRRTHSLAMTVFSLIAIGYHMLFATLVASVLIARSDSTPTQAPTLPVLAAIAVYGAGLVLSILRDRAWLILAALTWLFSVGVFGAVGFHGWDHIVASDRADLDQLAWIAPVLAIGFLTCPYLDLTFHRALREAPSHHAFAVFGVTFTVMIVLTGFIWFAPGGRLAPMAIGHLFAQSAFTVGAHLREMREAERPTRAEHRTFLMVLPLAAAFIFPIAQLIPNAGVWTSGENLYIRYLVFYGLLFPMYVLVFIGPGRPLRPTTKAVLIALAATIVLAPLYELGFIRAIAWPLIVPTIVALVWTAWRVLTRSRSSLSA